MAGPFPYLSSKSSLHGEITIPGDKSISHRALMLASQVVGTVTISGLLEAEDVLNTADALNHLGVDVKRTGNGEWAVEGVGFGHLKESSAVLNMGNSGTSTRLLMGLVTPYPFTTFFTGDDSLRNRPMARVMKPLEMMGAHIAARDGDKLPLALTGTKTPKAIAYELPVASAQVKSAILLAALNTPGTTSVAEPHPTRDHTENMLQHLGFKLVVEKNGGGKKITFAGKQQIKKSGLTISVSADPSSAAFAIVAALICEGSDIRIPNVCINPLRTGLMESLKEMGAKITYHNERTVCGEKMADISASYSQLNAITVPPVHAPSMIDEYPILAVAAAFAKGETVLSGLGELRVKESDRLAAIVSGLTACGVSASAEDDKIFIKGGMPKGGTSIKTNGDHRVAMSFLIMGMASREPVTVDDIRPIATSFPHFIDIMNGSGARMAPLLPAAPHGKPLVIAVDGPASSGKGTLARRLAEHYDLDYLDTGSLYRAVGLKLVYGGKDPSDKKAAIEAAKSIDDHDLSNPRLRQERIGQAASIVSSYPEVRTALLDYQRNFAKGKKGAVLDGRDIGTVVCPDADFKFFITATLYTRAKRRHRELTGENIEVVFESILEDLRERDLRDEKRAVAPLKPAEDAYIMDTSKLDASEVFAQACELIAKGQPHFASGSKP